MPLTLSQIPGFSDVADANFAAEQYAIGLLFQRIISNADFGCVRPEVFIGKYINGDTVPLPTSIVDGYTYSRDELRYCFHMALSGGTSITATGVPTQNGAIKYVGVNVDQVTGKVYTYVDYQQGAGQAPTITNDGTLEVFTIAMRRLTTLTLAQTPVFTDVPDSNIITDAIVTDVLMQGLNDAAKFSAVSAEIIYMGEFVNGDTVPLPISPADGYQYVRGNTLMLPMWRWTTLADQFIDPPQKQVQDFSATVGNTDGFVSIQVKYYNNGTTTTNQGRVAVFAFCHRPMAKPQGPVDFVDLDPAFLASGRPDRADVMLRLLHNVRYASLRTEFFTSIIVNGQLVPLPTSIVDGYTYSRDELTYVYDIQSTGPASAIRIGSWISSINQQTGVASVTITRVADGGGFRTTNDGSLTVITVARRNHEINTALQHEYQTYGNGGDDTTNQLYNGSFDNWRVQTDQAALGWQILQQGGTGYGAQAPGVVAGFSQRLGAIATNDIVSILSSPICVKPGDLKLFSVYVRPNTYLSSGFDLIYHYADAAGDTAYNYVFQSSQVPAGVTDFTGFVKIPSINDTTVAMSFGQDQSKPIQGTLNFIPSVLMIELVYKGVAANTYLDLDALTVFDQINPSVGQVAQKGSAALTSFPSIAFSVTATTFTPTLNLTINRADSTTTVINGGSPQVTSLTPATTYAWYPYYDEVAQNVNYITGEAGSPPMLTTTPNRDKLTAWYYIGRLPLAQSPISVVTPATGAPAAGGSGGGDNGCIHASQFVRERRKGAIRAENVACGDELQGLNGTWLRVLASEPAWHSNWVAIEFDHGGSLLVTSGHPFQDLDGKIVRAWALTLDTALTWERGFCHPVCLRFFVEPGTKVRISLEAPHIFLAGGTADKMTATHNFQMAAGASTL